MAAKPAKKAGRKAPARARSAKSAGARKKKAPARKASASASRPAGRKKTARRPARPKKGATSAEVHLGHVFALRPRVPTSFRPDDLRRAKQMLAAERFASVSEAARAVAGKALELTREGAPAARGRT